MRSFFIDSSVGLISQKIGQALTFPAPFGNIEGWLPVTIATSKLGAQFQGKAH
jgi:hypothetical protein